MAEVTRVWVRTATLDQIVYGKVKSTAERSTPGESSFEDGGDVNRNWGWARGEIIGDEFSSVTSLLTGSGTESAKTGIAASNKLKGIKVLIKDNDSSHHRNEIDLPGSIISDGNLVMANIYGLGEDDNDDDDDYGDDDDYYDDYGGGPSERSDAANKYPDDLIVLTHLHEPSVVYALRKRYSYDKIYTATGPILIAINPFKHCGALYSDKVMQQYWNRGEQGIHGGGGGVANGDSTGENKSSSHNEAQDHLPPHVYGIADHSFRSMMTKLEEFTAAQSNTGGAAGGGRPGGRRRPNASTAKGYNQSILVSGESGSGKTVTTKFIMQYLATLSKRSSESKARRQSSSNTTSREKADIEQQVLQSNPILESFGNARTIRNDNSSRFGKFIEIQFTNGGTLLGASVETYLLEKVRLITQAAGERNYHIFYEVLQGMEEEDLEKYFLGGYCVEDFNMTNQSGTFDRRDGVSDYDTYQDLILAMNTIGLTTEEIQEMLAIPCALLHASNINFNGVTADECEIDRSNEHLMPVLSLLGISADALNRALCYFSITAGREKHLRSLSKDKAEKGLLAVIKATYGALFTHIVGRVNQSIASKDLTQKGGRRGGQPTAAAYIAVLDIFGFESFRFNSFEQLCINYCNEALQQQFNLFVLKNEQEEYDREGIQWSFISFPDNQDVLDLIDKKGAGILNILDDQCKAPGTTDKTFVNDLYQKLSRHSRFQADFRQVGAKKFAVIHYAGIVEYSSEGFVEKNRDELPKEAIDLLLSSSNKFVAHLAQILSGPTSSPNDAQKGRSRPSMRPKQKSTVGGQFSRQLHELRQKIDETSPHYVRCLKPNDELIPDHFDPVVIADQLRCAGVIEAVRVSRVGYPQRYNHAMFVARYRILGIKALKAAARTSRRRKPVDVIVQAIASKIAATESSKVDSSEHDQNSKSCVDLVSVGIQVGKTKVFLRRKAYEIIEGLRNHELRAAAIKIQSITRRYIVLMDYNETQRAVVTIQTWARIIFAKRIVNEMRRDYNATLIQTTYRRFVCNRNYISILFISTWLQKRYRGNVGRSRYHNLNRERKSIVIQKMWRSNCCRKKYQKKKSAATTIQCALRCRFARQLFRQLRVKARDVHNIAEERNKLQLEIKALRKAYEKVCARAATAEAKLKDTSAHENVEALRQEVCKLQNEVKQVYRDKETETLRADNAIKKTSEVTERFECLKGQNVEINKDKEEMIALCTKKEQEIMRNLKEIEALKESNLTNSHKDANLEKEIKLLAKEMTSLLNDNTSLKKNLVSQEEKVVAITNLCEEKETEISKFKQEIFLLGTEIKQNEQIRNENLDLKEELKIKQVDLEAATSTCVERERKISSCMQEMEKLKIGLNTAETERNRYEQKSEAVKKEMEEVQERSNSLTAALEKARCELKDCQGKKSRSSNDPNSVDSPSEVTKLRAQNRTLTREVDRLNMLQENSSKSAIACDQLEKLNKEIESLRMEKKSLEENMNKMSRHVAIEKRANEQFEELIHDDTEPQSFDPNRSRPSSPMFSVGTESSDDQDEEVLILEEKIAHLKQELEEARSADLEKSTEMLTEVDSLRKALADSKAQATEEIFTLQDEVQYLNDELRFVKENGSKSNGRKQSNSQDNQVGKLIDSIVVKDEEIRDLRQEVAMLKDQLELASQPIPEYATVSHNMHDDDRSVVGKLFGSSPPHQASNDKDYIAVRKINESLMKDVEASKKKCEEYKKMIEDERKHSAKEIEAFAEALNGVDELRQAAEAMSREITRLKCNPEGASNNELENGTNSNPISRMEKAKRAIDISALKSTRQNIWGKVTQNFASKPTDSEGNEGFESNQKSNRRRRRKRRDGDDASIFSAFF